MKKYRCPYCGRETFDLLIKLGLNTKFSSAPRCSYCEKVSFRNFVVGGHFLYFAILGLSAFLTACGILASVKWNFNIGTLLFPIAFIAFYLIYNYYFCHFDRVQKEGEDEKIQLQLKETKNSWPDIRKGEIYEIGLLYPYDFATARDGYITAMVENITGDKLLLRVLSKPPTEYFELKGDVVIFCASTKYAATVIAPSNYVRSQCGEKDKTFNGIEIININRDDKKTTDWSYDFQSLPKWDLHTWAYTFDLFVELPKADTLFCIYSVVEGSMMNYSGRLAILQNKQKPKLSILSSDGIYFQPIILADYEENLVFMIAKLSSEDRTKYKEPIIFFDASNETFAFFETEGIGGIRKFFKKSNGIYEMQHEGFTINRRVSKNPLIEQIKTDDLKWHPLSMLNELNKIVF